MEITIVSQNDINFEFLIEREQGMYNNCNLFIELTGDEVQGLSANEVKTLAWLRAKPTAIRVFEQIEPIDEVDNPIGFELVPSVPNRIELYGNSTLTVGAKSEYQAMVYDQYNQVINTDLTWINKVITATVTGEVIVTASLGDLSKSLVVNVVERAKTKDEILQELVDKLIVDNINMQSQIDTLFTSSLGGVKDV